LDQGAVLIDADTRRILSLGCGDGTVDLQLLEPLRKRKQRFHYTGVDFNPVDLERFRQRLTALDASMKAAVTLRCMKYDGSTSLGQRFDLIYMGYFLQSFDQVMPAIANALRHLATGGRLVIIHQQQRGVFQLRKRFQARLGNQQFHSSDEIQALLRRQGIPFSSHTIESYFDVSVMQAMSLDALLLMSFCFCADLSRLEKLEQEEIRNAFLAHATAGTDGKLRIDEPMDAIVCREQELRT
jgi:SAM-dependent methyltransferase